MATANQSLLPVHELMALLEDWRIEPNDAQRERLRASLGRVLAAYGGRGVRLRLRSPNMPELDLASGSLAGPGDGDEPATSATDLAVEPMSTGEALLWTDGEPDTVAAVRAALQLAVDSIWSKQEARLRRRQLEALDLAVRGIAGVLPAERVLQLIVDRVRDLVDAQYAALGIVGPFGRIEQFVTSGLTDEQRRRIGTLPRGLGLLGLIIREDRDRKSVV